MPLAELLGELEREVDAQVGSLLREADLEAARRRVDNAARLEDRRRRQLAEATTRFDADAARALAAMERDAEAEWLVSTRGLVDRLFATAETRLAEPEWIERSGLGLRGRLAAALALTAGHDVCLEIEPALAGRVPGADSGLRLAPRAGVGAGFRVLCDGGAVEVDDRWATRLAHRRPELELVLARAIAEELA